MEKGEYYSNNVYDRLKEQEKRFERKKRGTESTGRDVTLHMSRTIKSLTARQPLRAIRPITFFSFFFLTIYLFFNCFYIVIHCYLG